MSSSSHTETEKARRVVIESCQSLERSFGQLLNTLSIVSSENILNKDVSLLTDDIPSIHNETYKNVLMNLQAQKIQSTVCSQNIVENTKKLLDICFALKLQKILYSQEIKRKNLTYMRNQCNNELIVMQMNQSNDHI
jgi:hypothetical protein